LFGWVMRRFESIHFAQKGVEGLFPFIIPSRPPMPSLHLASASISSIKLTAVCCRRHLQQTQKLMLPCILFIWLIYWMKTHFQLW
jgi:hypothetical protein